MTNPFGLFFGGTPCDFDSDCPFGSVCGAQGVCIEPEGQSSGFGGGPTNIPTGDGGSTNNQPTPTGDILCEFNNECPLGFVCGAQGVCVRGGATTSGFGDPSTDTFGDAGTVVPSPTVTQSTSPPPCTYIDAQAACSTPTAQGGPGLIGYTGTATRTTVSKNINGEALPLGCVGDLTKETPWDTSGCVGPTCDYTTQNISCSDLPGLTGYTGIATKPVVIKNTTGQPLPLGCTLDANLEATNWDTRNCSAPGGGISTPCQLITEEDNCTTLFGFNYVNPQVNGVVSKPSRSRFVRTNNVLQPPGCVIGNQVETDWDVRQCTRRTFRICNTSTDVTGLIGSAQELAENYESSTDSSGACIRLKVKWRECSDSRPTPTDFKSLESNPIPSDFVPSADNFGPCYGAGWRECGNNVIRLGSVFNNYIFNPTGSCYYPQQVPSESCTAPQTFRNSETPCINVDAKYSSGTAIQREIREYDPNGPAGQTCDYIGEWTPSGPLDVSLCVLAGTGGGGATTCTPPGGQATRNVNIPCSTIDRRYSNGNAIQPQIRRYNAAAPGPGECPFTWEDEGQPNVTACITPVFWRNCVTGDLVEGNAPANFIQVNYTGAGGGTCWEPIQELGFEPSLNEVLRYSYQRGSKTYPQRKTIKITNPAFSVAYRITFTTNSDIKLVKGSTSGNGTISFVIAPRSSETLGINITPTLLEKLQDGISSLSMAVDYERIIE